MFINKTTIVASVFFLLVISSVIFIGASHKQTDRLEYAYYKISELVGGDGFMRILSKPKKRVFYASGSKSVSPVLSVNQEDVPIESSNPMKDFAKHFFGKEMGFYPQGFEAMLLNGLGDEGWELVSHHYTSIPSDVTYLNHELYIFKRRK